MVDPAPSVRCASIRGLDGRTGPRFAAVTARHVGWRLVHAAGGAGCALFVAHAGDASRDLTTLQAMMFQLPELGLAVAGDGDPADLRRHQSGDHRHRQSGRAADGVDPDCADAAGRFRSERWHSGWSLRWLAGLVLCIVVGLLTGLLVAALGVHPILVTLGTMTLLHGFSIYFTRGRTLSGFPDAAVHDLERDDIWAVPISFVVFVGGGDPGPRAPDPDGTRDSHPHDRLQSRGDALFGRRYAARADLGLCSVEPAVLAWRRSS